jgi:hypothetical protein
MGKLLGLLFVFLLVGVPTYLITSWAYRDGEARGKPGWLVVLLVMSGPGLLVWLLFRPELERESRIVSAASKGSRIVEAARGRKPLSR